MVHGKLKKQVAGLLRRVVPFSDTVDQDLLHNFQRFVIIFEALIMVLYTVFKFLEGGSDLVAYLAT